MEKLIKKILVCLSFILIGCKHSNNSNYVECKDEIKNDYIYKSTINRGTLSLKGKSTYAYDFDSSCNLLNNDKVPKWVQDLNKPDYTITENTFETTIFDIDVPYSLFKLKDKCYFYVVKNNDTLIFKLK